MGKYWRGKTKQGKIIKENSGASWNDNRKNLQSLELVLEDGRTISLPENMEYIQAKTASANLASGECNIESRYIGFIQDGKKTLVRVNEKTNNITIETI